MKLSLIVVTKTARPGDGKGKSQPAGQYTTILISCFSCAYGNTTSYMVRFGLRFRMRTATGRSGITVPKALSDMVGITASVNSGSQS